MKKVVLLAILFFCVHVASAQTMVINTICGTGANGFGGDYGPAAGATLSFPSGICMDGRGVIYFSDAQNSRIRMIDTLGNIATIAGSGLYGYNGDEGPAIDAAMYYPQGICVDRNGRVYFADPAANVIRVIDTLGFIHVAAGRPGIDSFGYNGDGISATAAKLFGPMDVKCDAAGNLYIADAGSARIRKVDTFGIISTVAGSLPGLAGDGGPATAALMNFPCGIALDGSGNIFVADFSNNRVRKIDASGTMSTIGGGDTSGYAGDGGPATAALMYQPAFVAADPAGNVYIADQGNDRVREIDRSGIITTFAGNGVFGYTGDGGSPTDAAFMYPAGMVFSASGNMYVVDNGNFVIREIAPPLLGIRQPVLPQLKVFPDPASNSITVHADGSTGNADLTIRDVRGIIVKQMNTTRPETSIDISSLSDGLYFITYSASGSRSTIGFVKQGR
jgi:sugar lactone lactonase YvrE